MSKMVRELIDQVKILRGYGMLVKNVPKTTDDEAPDDSYWIDFWEEKSKLKAKKCSNIYCGCTTNLNGGHVKKVDSIDTNTYIVPLCKECNHYTNTESFKVASRLIAAPID